MRTFRWVLLRLAMLCRWAADGNRGGDKRIGTVSNGEPYDPAKYPYVVSLAMYRPAARSYGSCTGTLLSARFALTAAHCTDGVAPRDVKVKNVARATQGRNLNLSRVAQVFRAHRERSAVRAIHQHRGYDAKTLVADVSLLEVRIPRTPVFRRVTFPSSRSRCPGRSGAWSASPRCRAVRPNTRTARRCRAKSSVSARPDGTTRARAPGPEGTWLPCAASTGRTRVCRTSGQSGSHEQVSHTHTHF